MTNKAKGAPSGSPKKQQVAKWEFKGYVNVEVPRSARDDLVAWAAQQAAAGIYDLLLKAADSGYKVTVGETAKGMTAMLTNVDGPEGSRGYVASTSAGDAHRALCKLFYWHHVIAEGVWSTSEAGDDWGM